MTKKRTDYKSKKLAGSKQQLSVSLAHASQLKEIEELVRDIPFEKIRNWIETEYGAKNMTELTGSQASEFMVLLRSRGEDAREKKETEQQPQQPSPHASPTEKPTTKEEPPSNEPQTINVENKYFICPSKEIVDCFNVYNIEGDVTYHPNPYKGFCDCEDFKKRTKNGTCKHIEMCREHVPEVRERLEKMRRFEEIAKREAEKTRERELPAVPEVVEAEALMDRWDTEQTLSIMNEEVLDKYVYEMSIEGMMVRDISVIGCVDLAHWMGGYKEGEPVTDDRGDDWVAKIPITDLKRQFTVYGYATQEKIWSRGKKKGQPVHLAERVCVGKARANGYRKLIPQPLKQRVIERYLEFKKSK